MDAIIVYFLILEMKVLPTSESGLNSTYIFNFDFFFRLVPKPNCVKVPKEICVNTKNNPRRVKKPVVKEWCYRPSDLLDNSPSISHQTPDVSGNEASALFARRNKFFF